MAIVIRWIGIEYLYLGVIETIFAVQGQNKDYASNW